MHQNSATVTVDEAADWYLKHRANDLSPAERVAFAEWLRASPLNVREYLAIAALSNVLPDAAATSSEQLQTLIERARDQTDTAVVTLEQGVSSIRATHTPRRWAAAALLAVTIVGASWQFLTADTLKTAHGEQRTMRLSDGSLMHLNSASRAAVHFSASERVIDVEHGQLMFEVARDAARPFRVRVGAAEVTVLGTKFDVYRKAAETTVTVLEGKVSVRSSQTAAKALELTAGQQTRIVPGPAPPRAASVDTQTETAWLQGTIKFFRKPLAEVAEEFNRYGEKPIQIDDMTLRDLRVSGVFNAYDTDSFVEFVRRLDGVAVREESRQIRILSDPRTSALK